MGIYDRDYYQADDLQPLRPWDNKSMVTLLIIANLVFFIANFLFTSGSNAISLALALETNSLWNPTKLWQLVTYGFVHSPGNIFHILFNMATLYFLGRNVEDRLGKWEFFRFYMLTIVLCGIVWCGVHGGQNSVLWGASGAVTAVAMLFVFSFPHSTLMLMMAVPVKAWVVGVLIIVTNVFRPVTGDGSVAYDVHLVGAALAASYFFGGWNFGFLGSILENTRMKFRQKKRGLKVHRPKEEETQKPSRDDEESDRILDKIYREGEESLTAKERKFMERYSKRVRQRRGE